MLKLYSTGFYYEKVQRNFFLTLYKYSCTNMECQMKKYFFSKNEAKNDSLLMKFLSINDLGRIATACFLEAMHTCVYKPNLI